MRKAPLLKGSEAIEINDCQWQSHQKLCVKNLRFLTGGFAVIVFEFALVFGECDIFLCESLHRLRGPPPFDKGGFGALLLAR